MQNQATDPRRPILSRCPSPRRTAVPAPAESFLRACVDPEFGVSAAHAELKAHYGKVFVLKFYDASGAMLVSHLVEGVNDLHKATTLYKNRPKTSRIEVESLGRTPRP